MNKKIAILIHLIKFSYPSGFKRFVIFGQPNDFCSYRGAKLLLHFKWGGVINEDITKAVISIFILPQSEAS